MCSTWQVPYARKYWRQKTLTNSGLNRFDEIKVDELLRVPRRLLNLTRITYFWSTKRREALYKQIWRKNIDELFASSNSSKFFWRQYFLAYGTSLLLALAKAKRLRYCNRTDYVSWKLCSCILLYCISVCTVRLFDYICNSTVFKIFNFANS